MFTGIITHTGTVKRKTNNTLSISAPRNILQKLHKGDSVAVSGTCLTVIKKNSHSFLTNVIPETFKRTILGVLEKGDTVNLELPATPQTFLSGHIVQGHVDAVGTVDKIKKEKNQFTLSISIPKNIARYIAAKGSVTVDGVALTVIRALPRSFTVGIIPHTWKATTLSTLDPKSQVNIEIDILAKYAANFSK